MKNNKSDQIGSYTSEETSRRMERTIKQLLNTPPQPRGKNPKSSPPAKPKGHAKGRIDKG